MESRNEEEKNFFFKFNLLFFPSSHDENFFSYAVYLAFPFEPPHILSFREQTSQVSRNVSFRRFAVFLSSFHFVFQGIIYLHAVVLGKEMRWKKRKALISSSWIIGIYSNASRCFAHSFQLQKLNFELAWDVNIILLSYSVSHCLYEFPVNCATCEGKEILNIKFLMPFGIVKFFLFHDTTVHLMSVRIMNELSW